MELVLDDEIVKLVIFVYVISSVVVNSNPLCL